MGRLPIMGIESRTKQFTDITERRLTMRIANLSSSFVLLIVCQWCVWAQASDISRATDCEAKLEQARIYEMSDDPRTESEFRMVLAVNGDRCPDAFLDLSFHLRDKLKFREAAAVLKEYLRLAPANDRVHAAQDLRNLLS